jgi:hypothetical protein
MGSRTGLIVIALYAFHLPKILNELLGDLSGKVECGHRFLALVRSRTRSELTLKGGLASPRIGAA